MCSSFVSHIFSFLCHLQLRLFLERSDSELASHLPPNKTGRKKGGEQVVQKKNIQFGSGLMLLKVPGTAVEDPHQSLLVEAADLVFQRLDVVHAVALGKPELGDRWPRGYIVE